MMHQIRTFEDTTLAVCDTAYHAALVAVGVANLLGDYVWVWTPLAGVDAGEKLTMVMPSSDSEDSDRTAVDCLRRELLAIKPENG